MQNLLVFSIAEKINSSTKKPFGNKYDGEFKVRRPTIADNTEIQIRKAAAMNRHGVPVDNDQISGSSSDFLFIFTYMSVVGDKVPEWFDATAMYDDDEQDENAVLTVWKEVRSFIDSFRPKDTDSNGQEGSDQT